MNSDMLLFGIVLASVLGLSSAANCTYGVYNSATGKCYYLDNYSFTCLSMKQRCQIYGMDVVSIHSSSEENFVLQLASGVNNYWIGLNSINTTGVLGWTDGSPYDYNSTWVTGSTSPTNLCVHQYGSSGWHPHSSTDGQSYPTMCEYVFPSAVTCPNGTLHNNATNRCYKVFSGPESWSDARTNCRKHGGDLVSVHSDSESKYLVSLFARSSVSSYWNGFNMALMDTGNFTWSDMSAIDYTNWNSGVPRTCSDGPQKCVSVETSQGQWFNCWPCSTALPYICSIQPLSSSSSTLNIAKNLPKNDVQPKVIPRSDRLSEKERVELSEKVRAELLNPKI